jgi:hypothetical protein
MKYSSKLLFSAAIALSANGSAQAAAPMMAWQRAEHFGLSHIRGIAYIPGPAGPEKPVNPEFGLSPLPYFENVLKTYEPDGGPYKDLLAKYTIYYDSDFYNQDFKVLWGKDDSGKSRDDLGRYASELKANFVHLYDWNSDPRARNHKPFLDYASDLGMKVTIPISNYTYKIMCKYASGDWQENVKNVFNEVYGPLGTTPHPAAGILKIFNEYDGSDCKNARFVADVASYWKYLEDARNVPDEGRLPIIFPVTFGIANGIPGGAMLSAFDAIDVALGPDFWEERVIYATNPFNSGSDMVNWLERTLPGWFLEKGIPMKTPVMFTEYGRSADEVNPKGEAAQAAWVKEQFASVWNLDRRMESHASNPVVNFLGTCAFVNEYRFWLKAPEPEFALTDFGKGPGSWGRPPAVFVHKEQYFNPNANEGQGGLWDAAFQVDPQEPRQAYCEIAKVYGGGGAVSCP